MCNTPQLSTALSKSQPLPCPRPVLDRNKGGRAPPPPRGPARLLSVERRRTRRKQSAVRGMAAHAMRPIVQHLDALFPSPLIFDLWFGDCGTIWMCGSPSLTLGRLSKGLNRGAHSCGGLWRELLVWGRVVEDWGLVIDRFAGDTDVVWRVLRVFRSWRDDKGCRPLKAASLQCHISAAAFRGTAQRAPRLVQCIGCQAQLSPRACPLMCPSPWA